MKLSSKNWLVRLAFLGEDAPTESTTCDIGRNLIVNSFYATVFFSFCLAVIFAASKNPLKALCFTVSTFVVVFIIYKSCPWIMDFKNKICRKVEIEK